MGAPAKDNTVELALLFIFVIMVGMILYTML